MTPLRNNNNFLDSTPSLSDVRLSAIIDASMFCLMHLIHEAGRRTFQVNEFQSFVPFYFDNLFYS